MLFVLCTGEESLSIGNIPAPVVALYQKAEGYKELTAVKEGKLVEIDPDLLSRQGPRLADGLKAIAKLLHPDLFN